MISLVSGCGRGSGWASEIINHLTLSDHSKQIILALKFVEFIEPNGSPVLARSKVNALASQLGGFFSVCNIRFQVEEYTAVKASDYGLPHHLVSTREMEKIRQPFDDPRHLVIIDTGSWDHKKMGAPNAWTAMPGELPSGAVLESPVATFAGIVAHELGHYLSLNHVNNSLNLMNPIIYNESSQLTADQCLSVRTAAITVRSAAMRNA